MNMDNDKKQNIPMDGNWMVNPDCCRKSERAIIMVLKVIVAILFLPIAVFIVAAQFAPDEDDSSTPPRKDDPWSDFSMSRNGWD